MEDVELMRRIKTALQFIFDFEDSVIRHVRERGLDGVICGHIHWASLKEVEALARKIPCVLSPNMSVGVNVMFRTIGELARILGDDYDVEVIEAHHRTKKDAPSGTAMYIQNMEMFKVLAVMRVRVVMRYPCFSR